MVLKYLESQRHFNSQPHKEADRSNAGGQLWQMYFNSQPHKEADAQHPEIFSSRGISTHSLTRRLTPLGG